MNFDTQRPIYIQIADSICEKILSGELKADERILSVREYGAEIGVNPNTVSRSYERLTDEGVIYTRRGLGYFVSPEAVDMIREARRKEFLDTELPGILKKAQLLGIDIRTLLDSISTDEQAGEDPVQP